MLRGFFRGADDGDIDEAQQERLHSVQLPLHAKAIGRTKGEMAFMTMGTRLVSLRRHDGQVVPLSEDVLLMEGDTLVLSGKAEAIAEAELRLVKG